MTGFLPPLSAIAPIQMPTLPPVAPLDAPMFGVAAGAGPTASAAGSFGNLVSSGLDAVSRQLQTAQVDLQHLASGEVENLHQVMIRMEETRLSFQLMMQVRNRLLESYQEVMRMQV